MNENCMWKCGKFTLYDFHKLSLDELHMCQKYFNVLVQIIIKSDIIQ